MNPYWDDNKSPEGLGLLIAFLVLILIGVVQALFELNLIRF